MSHRPFALVVGYIAVATVACDHGRSSNNQSAGRAIDASVAEATAATDRPSVGTSLAPQRALDGALTLRTDSQHLLARFEPAGVTLTSQRSGSSTTAPLDTMSAIGSVHVVAFGREPRTRGTNGTNELRGETSVAAPTVEGDRVVYARGAGLREWYAAAEGGLEQGFDVAARPAGDGALVIEMRTPGLFARETANGQNAEVLALSVLGASGNRGTFGYGPATTKDARGRSLPTSLRVHDGLIELRVDDAGAVYPLVIDPLLFWSEQTTLFATDESSVSGFGGATAAAGHVTLVGARTTDLGRGAAYLFDGTSGTQLAKLTASDAALDDRFGAAVAFDGSTAVVTATGTNGHTGAAYVFQGAGTSWTQVAKLTPPGGTPYEWFGSAVAMAGSTIAVGAPIRDGAGAVYVFAQSGTTWTFQERLDGKSKVGTSATNYGAALALSGTTLAIGASGNDAVELRTRSGSTWPLQATIASADFGILFGMSVSLEPGRLVVGATGAFSGSGAAFVYTGAGAAWSLASTLRSPTDGEAIGFHVASSGSTVVASGGSTVCIFDDLGATWGTTVLTTSFNGAPVAATNDLVFVGHLFETGASNHAPGTVWSVSHAGGTWAKTSTMSPATGSLDSEVGWATALDADLALIGAPGADLAKGAAYVFAQSGSAWTQQAKLPAPPAGATPESTFGQSVALKNGVAAAASNYRSYVYRRSGTTWTAPFVLPYPSSYNPVVATDGASVAISGSARVAVFTPAATGTSWTQQGTIATPAAASGSFGRSLSIDGATLLVGDPDSASGAFVFSRTGTTWGAGVPLTPSPAPGASVGYGTSVSTSGGWAFVSTMGVTSGSGFSAYVFQQSGSAWVQRQQFALGLLPVAPAVAVSGDQALATAGGTVQFYSLSGTTWTSRNALSVGSVFADSRALSVSLSGNVALAGSPRAASGGGSATIFAASSANAGSPCSTNADCSTGFCVEGYCCNTACESQCAACNVAGNVGICTPIPAGTLPGPDRLPCDATGAGTPCAFTCDGTDVAACHAAGSATACGAASCADTSTATLVGTCDGAGTCAQLGAPCSPYFCAGTACQSACASDADCQTSFYCSGATCVAAFPRGATCTDNRQCSSVACIAGTCCNSGPSGCPTGEACNFASNPGTCLKSDGQQCTSDAQCGHGHCADGYCCNKACGGQCEACDVPAAIGNCIAVSGAPHGTRATCSDGGTNLCAASTCDGVATTSCSGFVRGASTSCAPAKCDGDQAIGASSCDGAGGCKPSAASSCVPYTCASAACATRCTSKADCASGFDCDTSTAKCVQGATCSANKSESLDKSGNPTACAPYVCGSAGTCMQACATTADCAAGVVCDTSRSPGQCVEAAGTSSSGCAVRRTNDATGNGWAAALGGAVVVAAMRRRRRAAFMKEV